MTDDDAPYVPPRHQRDGHQRLTMTTVTDTPTLDALPAALRHVDDAVAVGEALIGAISARLPQETRTIVIEVNNLTGLTLRRVAHAFTSGGFEAQALPHVLIGPGATDVFGVKSTGLATAVVGHVTYMAAGIDALRLDFTNPVVGSNAATVALQGPLRDTVRCIGAIGAGARPTARYTLFSLEDIGAGAVVVLLCGGVTPGPRYLDGRPAEGTVGLAPHTTGRYTGTRWRVHGAGGGAVTLKCLAAQAGPRFLDGRTDTGTVDLAPTTDRAVRGTRWEITRVAPLRYTLMCEGDVDEPRFLDGRTRDGSVGLALATDGDVRGTRWTLLRWSDGADLPTTEG